MSSNRLQRAFKVLLIAILIPPVLLVGIPWLLERSSLFAPEIRIPDGVIGVYPQATPFALTVRAQGGGVISSFKVTAVTPQKSVVILEKRNIRSVELREILPLSKIAASFSEGSGTLQFVAKQSGWIEGDTYREREFILDKTPPYLEPLQTPKEQLAASRILFFKAQDLHLSRTGIRREAQLFRGYPAWFIDREFARFKDLFVVAYARNEGSSGDDILFADDTIGNSTKISPPRLTSPGLGERKELIMTEDEYAPIIRRLFLDHTSSFEKNSSIPPEELKKALTFVDVHEEIRQKFAILVRYLRKENREEIARRSQSPHGPIQISNHFILPGGEKIAGFRDTVRYIYRGSPLREIKNNGLLLHPVGRSEQVLSANEGVVSYVGNLGVFGRCIIIYHGLGIRTLYAHLESTSVSEGARVHRGQIIGFTGSSGLVAMPTLYFEMDIGDVPVDPYEWGTPESFYSKFTSPIEEIRKAVGIPVAIPLAPPL